MVIQFGRSRVLLPVAVMESERLRLRKLDADGIRGTRVLQLGGHTDDRFIPVEYPFFISVAYFRQLPAYYFYLQARQSVRIV